VIQGKSNKGGSGETMERAVILPMGYSIPRCFEFHAIGRRRGRGKLVKKKNREGVGGESHGGYGRGLA